MINISVFFRWMLMKHRKLLYHVLLRLLFLVSLLAFNSACMEDCFLNNCLQPGLPVRGKKSSAPSVHKLHQRKMSGKVLLSYFIPCCYLTSFWMTENHLDQISLVYCHFKNEPICLFQLKLIWLDAIQHKVMVSWLQYKLMFYVFLTLQFPWFFFFLIIFGLLCPCIPSLALLSIFLLLT